jgi:hypothetical protein
MMIKLALTTEQLETIEAALETYCIGLCEEKDPHLAMAADAQKAIVTVLNEKCRGAVPHLPELRILAESLMPEHIELEYMTNGMQGGDSGHGGYTTLKIRPPSTCAIVTIGKKQIEISQGETIEITVRGDWESSGFACAFIKLGKKLFKKTRITD